MWWIWYDDAADDDDDDEEDEGDDDEDSTLTKDMRIVHIRVRLYTASNPCIGILSNGHLDSDDDEDDNHNNHDNHLKFDRVPMMILISLRWRVVLLQILKWKIDLVVGWLRKYLSITMMTMSKVDDEDYDRFHLVCFFTWFTSLFTCFTYFLYVVYFCF